MRPIDMRFCLELPTQRVDRAGEFVTAAAIADVTRAAAAAGFEAVFVTDHPAPDVKWLDHGGHHALDPFVALSFAAAADDTIRLLTNIYVAAYRNPFLGAKLVQSLDVLSGGRLILGVAAGYLKAEFEALGVDFEGRGALLDEALEVLDAVLTGDDIARDGAGYHARGVRLRPVRPEGRPPVWVGGNSRAAMRRAARFEGWAPFNTAGYAKASRTAEIETVDELAAEITVIRSMVTAGRPFDVCWSEALVSDTNVSVDERCSRVAALERAGVTWMTVSIPAAERTELLERIGTFRAEVIDRVSRVP